MVSDGVPVVEEELAIAGYVTPYDWSATLTFAIYRICRGTALRPRVRFLIFDVNTRTRAKGFIQERLFAFHNVIPWIQEYRITSSEGAWLAKDAIDYSDADVASLLRQAVPASRQEVKDLIRDVWHPNGVLSTFADDADRGAYLDVIREAWRQHILRPGDRHTVANMLGPLLLADGLPANVRSRALASVGGASPLRMALVSVLEELGLVTLKSESVKAVGAGTVGWEGSGGIFGRRSEVSFLLVDDQFRLGYQHVLGYTLLGEKYHGAGSFDETGWRCGVRNAIKIHCADSWEVLLGELLPLGPVDEWGLPRRFPLRNCDVLLLDLRLWLHNQSDRRQRFFTELVRVCNVLGAQRIRDQRLQAALSAAREVSKGKESNELIALPLLALLISHYDSSLPVLLFSSTHQRDVTEMVAHRRNIVASFAKPVLMGYGEVQEPKAALGDLIAALRKAMELHEARSVWERILDIKWGTSPVYCLCCRREAGGREVQETLNAGGNSRAIDPIVTDEHLKERLATLFREYVLGERYYDFASQPFEFLEGALLPPDVGQKFPDPGFRLVTGPFGPDGAPVPEPEMRRNVLCQALQNMRNRKAHGHVDHPKDNEEKEAWRLATILEFHILLDFVEGEDRHAPGLRASLSDALDDYWSRLRTQHRATLGPIARWPNVPLIQESLTSVTAFPWLAYTVMAAAQATLRSANGDYIMASQVTTDALLRLMA